MVDAMIEESSSDDDVVEEPRRDVKEAGRAQQAQEQRRIVEQPVERVGVGREVAQGLPIGLPMGEGFDQERYVL
jgi:hypothetical protein